jgi:hypothetical protein
LSDGQLPTSTGTIFAATAIIGTYIKQITLFNLNASNQVIRISVNRTGVTRSWRRFELQTLEAADVLDEGQTMLLEAGDLLLAETTNANSVDFTVSGVEES